MTRLRREGGWRNRKGRAQVSSNVNTGDGSTVQSISAGRDVSRVSQSASPLVGDQALKEVRVSLRQFRSALDQLEAGDDRDTGERAVGRIERGLDDPAAQRDTIEGAADTIAVMGRSIGALAGAATAVHQAVTALWS